jgi:hypothetical protein
VDAKHPLGLSAFEQREEAGHPHFWKEGEDFLGVESRLDSHPDWVVTARFFVGSRELQLVGLRINPVSDWSWPHPLTTPVIRNVHLDDLYELAAGSLSVAPNLGIQFEIDRAEFHEQRRPGRRGRSDLFYAEVAARYVEFTRSSSTATKDLAGALQSSPSSARDLLSEARRRNLLTRPPVKGRQGGELTEKAIEILRRKHGNGQ